MKLQKLKKCFLVGAIGYPLLEKAFRGRTHPSMALAGGLSMAAVCAVQQKCASRAAKSLAGALAITAVEGAVGHVFNRRHQVWDYRKRALNVGGQICPAFTALWALASLSLSYLGD